MLSDVIAIVIGLASVRVSFIAYHPCLRGAPYHQLYPCSASRGLVGDSYHMLSDIIAIVIGLASVRAYVIVIPLV